MHCNSVHCGTVVGEVETVFTKCKKAESNGRIWELIPVCLTKLVPVDGQRNATVFKRNLSVLKVAKEQ